MGFIGRDVVEKIVRKPTRVKGHLAKASPDHPEVLVTSTKSGAEAVHLPSELRPAKKPKPKKRG